MYGYVWLTYLHLTKMYGKCTIHGSYGICFTKQSVRFVSMLLPSMTCILSMDWTPPEADQLVIALSLSIWAIYLSNPSPDCFKAIFGYPDSSKLFGRPALGWLLGWKRPYNLPKSMVYPNIPRSLNFRWSDPPSWKGERTCITQRSGPGPQNSHVWGVWILRAGLFWQRYIDEKKLIGEIFQCQGQFWEDSPELEKNNIFFYRLQTTKNALTIETSQTPTFWDTPLKTNMTGWKISHFQYFRASHLSFRRV